MKLECIPQVRVRRLFDDLEIFARENGLPPVQTADKYTVDRLEKFFEWNLLADAAAGRQSQHYIRLGWAQYLPKDICINGARWHPIWHLAELRIFDHFAAEARWLTLEISGGQSGQSADSDWCRIAITLGLKPNSTASAGSSNL